jgi:hypothetical protein
MQHSIGQQEAHPSEVAVALGGQIYNHSELDRFFDYDYCEP